MSIATMSPWLSAYTAKMRELQGRDGPFEAGDRVAARGNWGVLVCDLRIHAERNPGAVYLVGEVRAEGRWLAALQDEAGVVYSTEPTAGLGPCYFRIVGECGQHFPSYLEGDYPGTYACARCDQIMPEVTEILRREVPDA